MTQHLTDRQAQLVRDLTAISNVIPAHLRKSVGPELGRVLELGELSLADHLYLLGKRPKAGSPVAIPSHYVDRRRLHFYFAENTTENEVFGTAGMASMAELAKLVNRGVATIKAWLYDKRKHDRDGWVTARHRLTPEGGLVKFYFDPAEDHEVAALSAPTLAEAQSKVLADYQRRAPGAIPRHHK